MKNLSRKEAMEILNDMKVKIEIPKAAVMQNKRNAALDMAIEALKCSEIPNCSDCISRQAAIENAFEVDTKDYGRIEVVGVDAILELPPAQPEIITCIECKYYDTDTEQCNNDKGLRFIDFSNPERMWCSWAERREEGDK